MKKLLSSLFVGGMVLLLLSACSTTSAQPTLVAASTQPEILIAEGRLLPVNAMDQSFSIPGQIAEVLVKDGDEVKTGQTLARLVSSPQAQAALANAQREALAAQQALDALKTSADLNLAQGRLAQITAQKALDQAQIRLAAEKSDENQALLEKATAELVIASDVLKELEAGAGVDPDQLASADARLNSAKMTVASAQAALDAYELKASLDGTVADLTLQAGEWVAAGKPVITLADFSGWVIKTDNLTEAEVVKLKVGQKVSITLDALPANTLNGEVTRINTRFEEKRGDITYTVTAAVSQADPQARWGMTGAVQFLP